jgi:hypothetical protein
MVLPRYIKKYFWDIDTNKAEPNSHKKYYVTRILDKGDKKAVSWLFKIFGKDEIKRNIELSRLSPRSANYWSRYFSGEKVTEKDNSLPLRTW